MSNFKFSTGDVVYFPNHGGSLYVVDLDDDSSSTYPLKLVEYRDRKRMKGAKSVEIFTKFGRLLEDDKTVAIFLANQENAKMLTDLYGISFDLPTSPYSSDYTRELLSTQSLPVLCFVSDCSDETALENKPIALISDWSECGETFKSVSGSIWSYAVPVPSNFKYVKGD